MELPDHVLPACRIGRHLSMGAWLFRIIDRDLMAIGEVGGRR
jgi:hypothetical protein